VTTIHLLRHAKAKNRAEWEEADELRPLTKRGRREAAALAAVLRDEPFARLASSPYLRCIETLEPLAAAVELAIETTELLAEGAEAGAALSLLVSLAGDGPIASSTHGDVVFEVVRLVAATGLSLEGPADVPVASGWIFQVEHGQVISGRFMERPAS
jgi:phosphohistidine phosphatase SixA